MKGGRGGACSEAGYEATGDATILLTLYTLILWRDDLLVTLRTHPPRQGAAVACEAWEVKAVAVLQRRQAKCVSIQLPQAAVCIGAAVRRTARAYETAWFVQAYPSPLPHTRSTRSTLLSTAVLKLKIIVC
jgi:hypothetical protein